MIHRYTDVHIWFYWKDSKRSGMTNYRNQQNTLPDTELCKPNWCEYSDKNSKFESTFKWNVAYA